MSPVKEHCEKVRNEKLRKGTIFFWYTQIFLHFSLKTHQRQPWSCLWWTYLSSTSGGLNGNSSGGTVKSIARWSEITVSPSSCSNRSRATWATSPPRWAMPAFCAKPLGFSRRLIYVAAASANPLSISSMLVILSRRFSLCRPLYFLYWRVVIPLQALEIISVSRA